MNTMLPVCSQCNQPIVLIDAAKRCTNPACGKVICFLCAARRINFCWACSNPLTALVAPNADAASADSPDLDVLAAAEQAALQERQEASQRRIEENAKEAREIARKQLELEAKRLEIETKRAAEDQQYREDATRIRRIASMTAALTESLRAFAQQRPDSLASSESLERDGAPLEFCGATCEVLHHAVGQLLTNATARANIYLTQEDYDRIHKLEEGIKELRTTARADTFAGLVLRLLTDCFTRLQQTTTDVSNLHSALRDAAKSFQKAACESGLALAQELALFTLPENPPTDYGGIANAIVTYCGNSKVNDESTLAEVIAGVDLVAASGCAPDNTRFQDSVAHVQQAVELLRRRCRDIHASCRSVLNSSVTELTRSHAIFAIESADHKYKRDLSEIVPEQFVEQMCGPSISTEAYALTCSEGLMLLHKVASAATTGRLGLPKRPAELRGMLAAVVARANLHGLIHSPSEAADLARAVAAFVSAVSGLDKLIKSTHRLPALADETLREACGVSESFSRIMTYDAVQTARSCVATEVTNAKQLLRRAKRLVEIGEVDFGIRVAALVPQRLKGLPGVGELKAAIEKQQSKVAEIEKSYAIVVDEFRGRPKGFAGLISSVFNAASGEEQIRKLNAFYRHQDDACIGPGTEVARKVSALIQMASEYCAEIGYTPRISMWVTLHGLIELSQPRAVSPEAAFVNALCAMAAVKDSIGAAEANVLEVALQGMKPSGVAVAVDQFIDSWRGIRASKQLVPAIAQAVVDVDLVSDPRILEELDRQLARVAKADGSISQTEATVYYALLARVSRRLYKRI